MLARDGEKAMIKHPTASHNQIRRLLIASSFNHGTQ
jgi:hypothetical protein